MPLPFLLKFLLSVMIVNVKLYLHVKPTQVKIKVQAASRALRLETQVCVTLGSVKNGDSA